MPVSLQAIVKIIEEDQHIYHLSPAIRSEIDSFVEKARSLRDLVESTFVITEDLEIRISDASHSSVSEEEDEEAYGLELTDVIEEFDYFMEQMSLLQVVIHGCRAMEEIPFDIRETSTLEEIQVDEKCSPSELNSANDLRRLICFGSAENMEPRSTESCSHTSERELTMQKLGKSYREDLYEIERQNSTVIMADEAETKGHVALSTGNYTEAIKHYTDAINLSPSDFFLYRYRSNAHYSLHQFSEALSDAKMIVHLKPDLSVGYLHLGDSYYKLNNYEDAISSYEKALEIDPDHDEFSSFLSNVKGLLACSASKFVEAIQHFTDAINLYPTNHNLYYNRSLAHANLKQLFEALSDAQKIVQLKPDWIKGYCNLGDTYHNLQKYKDALSVFERGLELDPRNDALKGKLINTKVIMAEEAETKGHVALSTGNYTEAIKHYTDAINLSPSDFVLYRYRSKAHYSLHQFSEALSDAKMIVHLKPDLSVGYHRLGDSYYKLNNYEDAISSYEKALEIDPDHDEFSCFLSNLKGLLACSARKFVEAIQHFTDAINLYPTNHNLYYKRSLAHANLKQLFEALSDAQKTVQLKPDWIEGYCNLGDTYHNLQKYKDALSVFEKGLKLDPSNDALKRKLINTKGAVAFFNGHFSDAIQHYTYAINLYPWNGIFYYSRSVVYTSLKQFSKALSDAQETVQLKPNWVEGYSLLGHAYFNLKMYKDALRTYEKGFEIDPTNDDLKCSLINIKVMADEAKTKGYAALSTGKYTEAIKHYTDAINLSPSDFVLYRYRSKAHYSLHQFSEALSDAKMIVHLKPDLSVGYHHLGASYYKLNNYEDAISSYEKALEIDPDHDEFSCFLSNLKGLLACSASKFVEAIQHFTDAINLYPTNHNLYYKRSLTHANLKQLFEALSDAQKTVQLKPDWIEGYCNLGDTYHNLQKYKDALSVFEKGLKLDPSNDALKRKLINTKGAVAFFNGHFFDAIQHYTYAINLYPWNGIFYYSRSVVYTSLKQFSKALSDAQETVQLKPNWVEGYSLLGHAYFNLKMYKDALRTYEKGFEIDPTNDDLKCSLINIKVMADEAKTKGYAALSTGKYTEAIKHYTDAINLSPSDHFLYSQRSLVHYSLDQFSEALSDAKKVVQLKPDLSIGYICIGYSYFKLRNYKDAISALEKALEIDPDNDCIKSDLSVVSGINGRLAFSRRKFVEAIQHYTDAINLYPTNHNFYYNRSLAHTRLKQFFEAFSDAQKIVQLKPNWIEGYYLLGDAYLNLRKYKDALSAYKKGLEIDPSNDTLKPALFSVKGLEAFNKGSFVEAVQYFTDGINLHPSDYNLYKNRSLAHAHLKQLSEALSDAQKTVQLKPDWVEGYSLLGSAYFDLQKYKDALSAYNKGFEIDPNNEDLKCELVNAKGAAAFYSGNFDDSIHLFTDAINSYPSNHILYSNRSEAHASFIQFSKAMSDAQKTILLHPGWSKGYLRLGDVYLGLGIYKDAVSTYNKGLEIDPIDDELKSALTITKAAWAIRKRKIINQKQELNKLR